MVERSARAQGDLKRTPDFDLLTGIGALGHYDSPIARLHELTLEQMTAAEQKLLCDRVRLTQAVLERRRHHQDAIERLGGELAGADQRDRNDIG